MAVENMMLCFGPNAKKFIPWERQEGEVRSEEKRSE